MKHYLIGGTVLASALLLAGCGGSKTETTNTTAITNSTTTEIVAPVSNETATANEAAPVEGKQDFKLINKTGSTVTAVNVSATSKDDWEEDILGQDTLGDGETVDISFAPTEKTCKWDLRATYDDDTTTEMKDINLCEIGTVTLTK